MAALRYVQSFVARARETIIEIERQKAAPCELCLRRFETSVRGVVIHNDGLKSHFTAHGRKRSQAQAQFGIAVVVDDNDGEVDERNPKGCGAKNPNARAAASKQNVAVATGGNLVILGQSYKPDEVSALAFFTRIAYFSRDYQ